VAFVSERPKGKAVSLESWRDELTAARKKSVGRAGLCLDRSSTGAGKSYADRAALEVSGSGLIVTPIHLAETENGRTLRILGMNANLCLTSTDAETSAQTQDRSCLICG
jgi:hypothetical protein